MRKEIVDAIGENTPMPQGESERPAAPAKRTRADALKDSVVEAQELSLLKMALQGDQANAGHGSEVAAAMVPLVTGLSTALTTMMTSIANMNTGAKADPEQSAFQTYLVGEMKDMKGQLLSAGSSSAVDQLTLMENAQTRILAMEDEIKQRMGVTDNPLNGATLQNAQLALQLQEMQNQAAERTQQFELLVKGMERRWVVEDRRWEMEYQLKVVETKGAEGQKSRGMDVLEDLAGAVIESIGAEEGAGDIPVRERPPKRPPQEQAEAEQQPEGEPTMPSEITCPSCSKVQALGPDTRPDQVVQCIGCDAEIEFTPPSSRPPSSRRRY